MPTLTRRRLQYVETPQRKSKNYVERLADSIGSLWSAKKKLEAEWETARRLALETAELEFSGDEYKVQVIPQDRLILDRAKLEEFCAAEGIDICAFERMSHSIQIRVSRV